MRGRKPTPTKLKELAGNPGHRPLNKAEPCPNVGIPDCPNHLDQRARREWKRISAALEKLGLITEIDRSALAAYCVTYSRWAEAEKKVRVQGVLIGPPDKALDRTPVFGQDKAPELSPFELTWNPYLAVANKAMEQMLKILGEFGMTPSSRARVKGAGDTPADATEKFLFGPGPDQMLDAQAAGSGKVQ